MEHTAPNAVCFVQVSHPLFFIGGEPMRYDPGSIREALEYGEDLIPIPEKSTDPEGHNSTDRADERRLEEKLPPSRIPDSQRWQPTKQTGRRRRPRRGVHGPYFVSNQGFRKP